MVTLAQSSPGGRSARALQSKKATVVLVKALPILEGVVIDAPIFRYHFTLPRKRLSFARRFLYFLITGEISSPREGSL